MTDLSDPISKAIPIIRNFLERTRDEESRTGTFKVDRAVGLGGESEDGILPVAIMPDSREIRGNIIGYNVAQQIVLAGDFRRILTSDTTRRELVRLVRQLPMAK